MPAVSPDRAKLHEKISDIKEFGYLNLIERRQLALNTVLIIRQSQKLDNEPLPADELKALMASANSTGILKETLNPMTPKDTRKKESK